MPSKRVIGILLVAAMAVPAVGLPDWKGDLAKKTVGRAAREGIEDALKDEAVDAALSAAARGTAAYVDSRRLERDELVEIGAAVGTGVEVAMQAADVADALDDAADVAKTLNKVNKIRKAIP